VRIPAELAYADTSQQLTIARMGDVITIYPARRSIAEMVAKLRAMPKPFGIARGAGGAAARRKSESTSVKN
jgi:virulence-associated protein VagC